MAGRLRAEWCLPHGTAWRSPTQKAAIKLIPADAEDAEARIAGWTAAAPLSHPHLMRLFYTGRCQFDDCALLYAVTEYADEILAQILPERALTPAEVKEMLDPRPRRALLSSREGLRAWSPQAVEHSGRRRSVETLHATIFKPWASRQNRAETLSVYDAPERATSTISPPPISGRWASPWLNPSPNIRRSGIDRQIADRSCRIHSTTFCRNCTRMSPIGSGQPIHPQRSQSSSRSCAVSPETGRQNR